MSTDLCRVLIHARQYLERYACAITERLCSRRYSDFLAHPFFEGLDLNALEDGSHFIEYDGVTSLMQPSSENPDDFSPKISDELQATRAEYLEPEKTKVSR